MPRAKRELTEEEVATLVIGLTMLLNDNAASADKSAHAGDAIIRQPEQELLAINARQQDVVVRLLSELEAGPRVILNPP